MHLLVVCVGRQARDPLLSAADDYATRLGRYARLQVERVREGTTASEGDALLRHIPPQAWVCTLDERGQSLSTTQFAAALAGKRQAGVRQAVFVVGGAAGLSDAVRQRAQLCLALSPFTLPHRLALVTLLEQLYRVHTLWRGEPYHRA